MKDKAWMIFRMNMSVPTVPNKRIPGAIYVVNRYKL